MTLSVPRRTVLDVETLTELEEQILAFEAQLWTSRDLKAQAIKHTFDLTDTRYYQLLNDLIDEPAALAHSPMLVGRLRRLRGRRQSARSARRLA